MNGPTPDPIEPALRVMLIDDDPKRAGRVQACLTGLGYHASAAPADPMRVLKSISDLAPDVILIDMDFPGRDLLESLAIVKQHQPTPIAMFSGEEDPDYINRAVEAGVSTYLVGSIDPAKVKPIIQVAMAQFKNYHNLRQALDDTRHELDNRRTIERAKLLIMGNRGCSEEQAYHRMRELAMTCRLPLAEAARRIIQSSTESSTESSRESSAPRDQSL